MEYRIHDETTASGPAADLLKKAKEKYGFVPNVLATMAEAPALLKAYLTLGEIMGETSFDAAETEVISLAASFANGCAYCVAAHSAVASMQNVADDVITALRTNKPIPDARLEALRRLAQEITETQGYPSQEAIDAFIDKGYTKGQLLEVILGVGIMTLSNYTNHIAGTKLDEAFEKMAWTPDQAA